MKLNLKTLSVAVLLFTLTLFTGASCSRSSDTGDTSSGEDTASTTEQARATTTDNASPATLSPDPAFDSLVPTLRQMTTAPIMLSASLPPEVGGVAIEQDPNEGNRYTTGGDKYTILLLYSNTNPSQIVQSYVHYMTLGRLTASPTSTPSPDPTNSLGTPHQLGDVALPDGTVANLVQLEPLQGANYGPFTIGTFEEEGERYTVMIENDSPEGDLARQMLSTMVKVPSV